MYNAAGMWEEAHHLASKYMDPTEVRILLWIVCNLENHFFLNLID